MTINTLDNMVMEELGWGASMSEVNADIVDRKDILRRISTQLEDVVETISQLTIHVSNMDYHFDDLEGHV
jgi:hypothetical protein